MSSLNKVILIGKLGKDPEIRTMSNGNRVATFSVATSESWKDKNTGEKKEKTEWSRVVVFNDRLVGTVERFLTKGSKIYLEGQLQTRKWTSDDGKENQTTEVVLQQYRGEILLLDGKKEAPEQAQSKPDIGGSYDGPDGTFKPNPQQVVDNFFDDPPF